MRLEGPKVLIELPQGFLRLTREALEHSAYFCEDDQPECARVCRELAKAYESLSGLTPDETVQFQRIVDPEEQER